MKKAIISIVLCLCLLPTAAFAAENSKVSTSINGSLPENYSLQYNLSYKPAEEASAEALAELPFWLFNGSLGGTIHYENVNRQKAAVSMKENTSADALTNFWVDWDKQAPSFLYITQYAPDTYAYYNLTGKTEEEQAMLNQASVPLFADASVLYQLAASLTAEAEAEQMFKQNKVVYTAIVTGQAGVQLLSAISSEIELLFYYGVVPTEAEKAEFRQYYLDELTKVDEAGVRLLDSEKGICVTFSMDANNVLQSASFEVNLDADIRALSQLNGGEGTPPETAKGTIALEFSCQPAEKAEEIVFPVLTEKNSVDLMKTEAADTANTLTEGWNIVVDGKVLGFKNLPYVKNDRALASGQVLCTALGAAYTYENGVLNINNGEMIFTGGSALCLLHGAETALDVTVEEVDSELFVPVRFLAENLGYKVEFRQQMAENGASVFASIVLIDPVSNSVRALLPAECDAQNQILQIAAALTGVTAEISEVEGENYRDKALLMAAAGEKVVAYGSEKYKLTNHGYDGLFCDLTPYLEKAAPEVLALISENEAVRQNVTDETGAVIAFPVQYGSTLEWFYISGTNEDVESIIYYLKAYSEVAQALTEA